MKKLNIFLTLAALAAGLFSVTLKSDKAEVKVNADFDETLTRITVVRPDWWEGTNANQRLVIGASSDFNAGAKQFKDTGGGMNRWIDEGRSNVYNTENYTADDYYKAEGGFTEYNTSGLLFYDIKISEITGKYFSFFRIGDLNNDGWGEIWNMTPPIQYTAVNSNKLYRIWGNGEGTVDVGKSEAQNVKDAGIAALMYGYISCADNEHNGYKAYTQLNSVYDLDKRLSSTAKVADFKEKGHYTSGKNDGNQVNTDLGLKLTMMNDLNGGSQSVNITTANNSLNSTLVIATLGLTTIVGYYFLSRKKKPA